MPGVYPTEVKYGPQRDICTPKLAAPLFTTGHDTKAMCLLTGEWIKKLWSKYTADDCYSASEQEGSPAISNNRDEPRRCYVKRNKPHTGAASTWNLKTLDTQKQRAAWQLSGAEATGNGRRW